MERSREVPARVRALAARVAPALALSAALLAGCTQEAAARTQGRGVLLIAVDALRADHLSGLGYDRATTPGLDQLAEEGVVFTETLAAAPWLLPSQAALLTGCDPNVSRWNLSLVEEAVEHRWRVPAGAPHLAVSFLVAGYATAAFVDHEWMGPVYGFEPGFQVYDELNPGRRAGAKMRDGLMEKSKVLLQWLRSLEPDQPWFAFLQTYDLERVWHFTDPKWDYYFEPRPGLDLVPPISNSDRAYFAVPRERWSGGPVSLGRYEARYDGAVRRLDSELQDLFEMLRVTGRWDSTTVCVVGSHGLQFGEAGLILDHGLLSVADLHVPWILRSPWSEGELGGGLASGLRVGHLASLMDVAPTLLELEGLPVPPAIQGVSQVAQARGADHPAREFAFASCGLQQGNAVFGARLTWEYVQPGNTAGVPLRTTWFGDDEPHEDAVREVLYDRVRTPYPFLDESAELPLESAGPLREAFFAYWLETMHTRSVARGEAE